MKKMAHRRMIERYKHLTINSGEVYNLPQEAYYFLDMKMDELNKEVKKETCDEAIMHELLNLTAIAMKFIDTIGRTKHEV